MKEKFNCLWLWFSFFHASELGVSFSTLLTVDLFRHELDTIGLMCAGRAKIMFSDILNHNLVLLIGRGRGEGVLLQLQREG